MGFAGKANIGGNVSSLASTLYGVCSTGSETAAKVVTCPDFDTLLTGVSIAVKFLYTNAAANPTLNVNGTGALPIYTNGTKAPGAAPLASWAANSVVSFTYDGNAWMMNDNSGSLFDLIYPVGSVYMSINDTNPGLLFGGVWEQIKDKFLLSAGDTYAAGATGGAATVALAEGNLPSHRHSIPALSGTAAENGLHVHNSHAYSYALSKNAASHTMVGVSASNGSHNVGAVTDLTSQGWTDWPGYPVEPGGSHAHNVTTNANNSGYVGSGTAHENMPPYLAVYVWKRTA